MLKTLELQSSALPSAVVDMTIENILGIALQTKSNQIVVKEVSREGAFARHRLKAGDQILAINGQRVRSVSDVETVIANLKSEHKGSAIFTIRRGSSQGQIELPI